MQNTSTPKADFKEWALKGEFVISDSQAYFQGLALVNFLEMLITSLMEVLRGI